MLDIIQKGDGVLSFVGRFDASQTDSAKKVLDSLGKTTTLDFADLEYISSAGLGVLLATQKRLKGLGEQLILRNLNMAIRDIFRYARFDLLFKID